MQQLSKPTAIAVYLGLTVVTGIAFLLNGIGTALFMTKTTAEPFLVSTTLVGTAAALIAVDGFASMLGKVIRRHA